MGVSFRIAAIVCEPEQAEWDSFEEVKADFGSADRVGRLTIFDIGGNKHRQTASLEMLGDLAHADEECAHPMEPASDAAMLDSLLADRGQTRLQVAAATGIANSTLSNMRHGKRQLK